MNLEGKKVVITRSADQAPETVKMVRAAGGIPILFPTIEIVEPESWEPVDRAIGRLKMYQWVIFTSVNGVGFFTRRMEETGVSTSALGGARLCAIGPATAEALKKLGLNVTLMPEKFVAESVLEALENHGALKGARILLPRAEIARNTLPDGLRTSGAQVDVVTVYRTVRANPPEKLKRDVIDADIITFTSPSTLTNFLGIMENQAESALKGKLVACIGPVTRDKAEELGVPVHVVPEEYTLKGLLEALERM